jgi:hypothetical protein
LLDTCGDEKAPPERGPLDRRRYRFDAFSRFTSLFRNVLFFVSTNFGSTPMSKIPVDTT